MFLYTARRTEKHKSSNTSQCVSERRAATYIVTFYAFRKNYTLERSLEDHEKKIRSRSLEDHEKKRRSDHEKKRRSDHEKIYAREITKITLKREIRRHREESCGAVEKSDLGFDIPKVL